LEANRLIAGIVIALYPFLLIKFKNFVSEWGVVSIAGRLNNPIAECNTEALMMVVGAKEAGFE
jgi:hypothetical protein